jgi:hypothetical protein
MEDGMRAEEKFAALEWRAFLRASRADHTRNLSRPWYVSERVGDNSARKRWDRQAQRYADWYVRSVMRLDGHVREVRRIGRIGAVACAVVGGKFQYVMLPDHVVQPISGEQA